jgi:hypothetical protein
MPQESKYYINLQIVTKNVKIGKKIIGKNVAGVCKYNAKSKNDCLGKIIISSKCPLLSTLVHEITHAAMYYISDKILRNVEVENIDDKSTQNENFFIECFASITENLMREFEESIACHS